MIKPVVGIPANEELIVATYKNWCYHHSPSRIIKWIRLAVIDIAYDVAAMFKKLNQMATGKNLTINVAFEVLYILINRKVKKKIVP